MGLFLTRPGKAFFCCSAEIPFQPNSRHPAEKTFQPDGRTHRHGTIWHFRDGFMKNIGNLW
jgi:hypothetical protein